MRGVVDAQNNKLSWSTEMSQFPLVAFIALFGDPFMHAYGRHTLQAYGTSSTVIELQSNDAAHAIAAAGVGAHFIHHVEITDLGFVLPSFSSKRSSHLCSWVPSRVKMRYDSLAETADITVTGPTAGNTQTLDQLWSNSNSNSSSSSSSSSNTSASASASASASSRTNSVGSKTGAESWMCSMCTFVHHGTSKVEFLACEVCGSERHS